MKDEKDESLLSGIIMAGLKDIVYTTVKNTLIPQVKKLIVDMVDGSVRMALYGTTAKPSGSRTPTDTVSYGTYYSNGGTGTVFSRNNLNNISREFEDKDKAKAILDELQNIINTYGVARVADFKELGGGSPVSTDNDYGWKDISNARIVQTTYGWRIEMPRSSPINMLR